jgi:uncharacterized protein (TIGR02266 family)
MPPDSKTPEIVAHYDCATLDELVAKHAEDVSAEGMLLRTASALGVGKLVDFEVQLQSGKSVLSGAGRVAWKRDAPDGERPAGVAIKFVDLDEAGRAVVEQFLAARMTQAGEFDLVPPATAAKKTVLGMGSPFASASVPHGSAPATPPASSEPPRSKTALGLSPVQVSPSPEKAARVGTHLGLAPPTVSAGLVLDEPSSPAVLPASRPQATSDIDQGWLEPAKGSAKGDGKAPSTAAKGAPRPEEGTSPGRRGAWFLVGLLVLLAVAACSYRFRAQIHDAGLPAIPTIDGLPAWLSGDSPTSETSAPAAAPAPSPLPASPPPPQPPAPKGKSGGSRK